MDKTVDTNDVQNQNTVNPLFTDTSIWLLDGHFVGSYHMFLLRFAVLKLSVKMDTSMRWTGFWAMKVTVLKKVGCSLTFFFILDIIA